MPLFVFMMGIGGAWLFQRDLPLWFWLCGAGVSGIAFGATLVIGRRSSKKSLAREIRGAVYIDKNPFIWWKRQQRVQQRVLWVLLLCIFFLGGTLCKRKCESVAVSWPSGKQMWVGHVEKVYKLYAEALQVDLKLERVPFSGKTVRVHLENDNPQSVIPGTRLALWTQIEKPHNFGNPNEFDYVSFLTVHGISGTGYCSRDAWQELPSVSSTGEGFLGAMWTPKGWKVYLYSLRTKLVNLYAQYFEGADLAILSALTLGERSTIGKETKALFSETGTSHVLALSGLHLGILFFIFNFLLLSRLRGGRLFCGVSLVWILMMWLFVVLCGAPLSLQRAAWMYTFMQLGLCVGKERSGIHNLTLAAWILLLFSPLSLFDVGFQLSFCAVAAILWGMQTIGNRKKESERLPFVTSSRRFGTQSLALVFHKVGLRLSTFVKSMVLVSLFAQIGTLPFVIYYFHIVAPYTCLSNFLVIPAVYVILFLALFFFLLPFSRLWVVEVLAEVIDFLQKGLEFFASWPFSSIHIYLGLPCLLGLSLTMVVGVLYLRRRKLRFAVWACVLVVVSLGLESFRLRPDRLEPQIIVYSLRNHSAVQFFSHSDRSFLYASVSEDSAFKSLEYVENSFWKPLHLARPQWIGVEGNDKKSEGPCKIGNVIFFGGKRIALVNAREKPLSLSEPLRVDVLVVGRGCRLRAEDFWGIYDAEIIVLEAGLSQTTRRRLTELCTEQGLKVYDVRENGAFVFPLLSRNT